MISIEILCVLKYYLAILIVVCCVFPWFFFFEWLKYIPSTAVPFKTIVKRSAKTFVILFITFVIFIPIVFQAYFNTLSVVSIFIIELVLTLGVMLLISRFCCFASKLIMPVTNGSLLRHKVVSVIFTVVGTIAFQWWTGYLLIKGDRITAVLLSSVGIILLWNISSTVSHELCVLWRRFKNQSAAVAGNDNKNGIK